MSARRRAQPNEDRARLSVVRANGTAHKAVQKPVEPIEFAEAAPPAPPVVEGLAMSGVTALAAVEAVAPPVPPVEPAPVVPVKKESVADRVRRLQAEAKALARQQVDELAESMRAAAEIAHEVAEGGDAYPPGARDLARRLADDLLQRAQTLEAILAKAGAAQSS